VRTLDWVGQADFLAAAQARGMIAMAINMDIASTAAEIA